MASMRIVSLELNFLFDFSRAKLNHNTVFPASKINHIIIFIVSLKMETSIVKKNRAKIL